MEGKWRKSYSCSSETACVEIWEEGDTVKVRDSKLGEGSPVLEFSRDEWKRFVADLKRAS